MEKALDHANNTEIDGKKMVQYEWVQAILGEMYSNYLLARLAYAESNTANGLWGPFYILNIPTVFHFFRFLPASFSRLLFSSMR